MAHPYPDTPDFSGHNVPCRIECDIFDLVVEGELPEEIDGAWYRSIPDPQFPPQRADDTYISGDGMVSVFRISKGHVDFRMRYVQTERWKNERAARRALYGAYRNPFTDDPSVRGKGRGVANTTPIYHAGRLFAAKEDSRAWEVDPLTLETRGEWDYQGRLRSQTMTPHPRIDPDTGEMYFFGYEAGGLATRDVAYCVANRDGELVREDWFEAPYCALMHDFAVTKEHAIFPVFPITADLARLEAGGPHWVWEGHRDSFIGIMPRDGSVAQLRWFRGPPCSAFHFMNAFTEGNKVHLDFSVTNVPVFGFIRAASKPPIPAEEITGEIVRWSFDLAKPGDGCERTTLGPAGDLPRIANRDAMRDYDVGYYGRVDFSIAPPLISGPVGPGFNALSRLEVRSGRVTTLAMDARSTLQEPVHIESKIPGHEGYLAFLVDRHDQNVTEAFIVEAEHLDRALLARIMIPMRLRSGVHGTWVPSDSGAAGK
ncbi:MAG TPA: carotenoid oxygenase family protein [Gammaproteobacteria bacterium]|nr:carotenoid oxygenase family protein [Gammaproteobacteria bacterium]